MDIENKLNKLKADYQRIEPPVSLLSNGWQNLESKLTKPGERKFFLVNFRNRGLAMAALSFIFIIVGLFGINRAVQASLPGENLYPIKCWCDDLVSSVTGSSQMAMDHRAQEIVALIKENEEDNEVLNQAIVKYQLAVTQTKEEVDEDAEEKSELDEKLAEHHLKFEELVGTNSSLHNELERAVEEEEDKDRD